MRKVFKCVAKETGYHLTQGKNYHNIINDKGVQHYIWDDDLEKFFIDLEQVRQDKLEELLK